MAESTVLVVDDEPLILEFLAENLRADDFTVLTAANGGEAIDALAASRPDVVLLDVVLPDMSGYDVCRRVRGGDAVNDPWDPDLPIIMLLGEGRAHGPRPRSQPGADDYVTKPFHYPELLARIGAVLKRVSRARDAHQLVRTAIWPSTSSRARSPSAGMRGRALGEGVRAARDARGRARAASSRRRSCSRSVWDFRSPGSTRTLDSHASRLRQKLARHSDAAWIANVWGVGYRLCRPAVIRDRDPAQARGGVATRLVASMEDLPRRCSPTRSRRGRRSSARCRTSCARRSR